jgi:catechol 2,3-dioxygenase-like lactoylglutathione lyase family enzyme
MPKGEEEQARAFYEKSLGLSEVPKPAELLKRGGVWFRSGEVAVHLGVDPHFRPATKAHPAFRCIDYDGLLQRLQAHEVTVTPDDQLVEGKAHSYVSDPFGNRIELIAE